MCLSNSGRVASGGSATDGATPSSFSVDIPCVLEACVFQQGRYSLFPDLAALFARSLQSGSLNRDHHLSMANFGKQKGNFTPGAFVTFQMNYQTLTLDILFP